MHLQVRLVADPARAGGGRPATGTPVRIEVRDVTEQDVASTVVAAVDTEVGVDDDAIARAAIDVDESVSAGGRRDLVVWARVAVSGADQVDRGDWITMGSVPVGGADPSGEVEVEVRPVG